MIYILIVILTCILLLGLYIMQIYNGLILLKHNVNKAWSNIDVLLKQRHTELGKLIAVCREHIKYEAEVLENVAAARNAVSKASAQTNIRLVGKAETELRKSFKQLLAVAEQYPELQAIQSYTNLGKRISTLETHITDRRELYNESVNLNNVRIDQFPDSTLASFFGLKKAPLLRFSDGKIVRNSSDFSST